MFPCFGYLFNYNWKLKYKIDNLFIQLTIKKNIRYFFSYKKLTNNYIHLTSKKKKITSINIITKTKI